MANVEKLSISLPSDLVEYIKDSVGAGSYSTTSEFLRETLRDRRRREIEERYRARLVPRDAAHLKQMIQEGIDSIENGRSYPAKEVFEKLIAKYERMAKAPQKARKPKR